MDDISTLNTRTYKAKLLEELPSDLDSYQLFYFPPDKKAQQDGLIVRVTSEFYNQRWIGMFSFGFPDFPALISGLYCPANPDELCVVSRGAAYLIEIAKPASCIVLPVSPVKDVVALPQLRSLLLTEDTRLLLVGNDGYTWKSEKLVRDDLRFERLEGLDVLVVSGWDPVESERSEVRVAVVHSKPAENAKRTAT